MVSTFPAPFWTESTQVSSPMMALAPATASRVAFDLTASSTRSTTPTVRHVAGDLHRRLEALAVRHVDA